MYTKIGVVNSFMLLISLAHGSVVANPSEDKTPVPQEELVKIVVVQKLCKEIKKADHTFCNGSIESYYYEEKSPSPKIEEDNPYNYFPWFRG